ncbi:DUF4127 family protein [Mycoplasmatota bacterium]|nr:DUF4127 family protein [Mycoplasmatota bacterium]
MKKKIILIPLDERPCNQEFQKLLTIDTDYEVLTPPLEYLGLQKKPGDIDKIWNWLHKEVKNAFGLILSIDTLLYGGLVPSRLHNQGVEELLKRIDDLKAIKTDNKDLKIYAFDTIMRTPSYSSDDEEPDYYNVWGKDIHDFGALTHKVEVNVASESDKQLLSEIKSRLPMEFYQDYTDRRKKNVEVTKRIIDFVKDETIDFMVIPQDDATPFGLTAKDQIVIRQYIHDQKTQLKAYMYPDADGVANTLLARLINVDKGIRPSFYVKYASEAGKLVIPCLEDRHIIETIKYQILAVNGVLTSCVENADVVLMINVAPKMFDVRFSYLKGIEHDVFRNLIEYIEYADYAVNTLKKPVIIGDVAYANGSDLELVDLIYQKGLTYKLAGYAAWNSSSNSLATAIAQGIIYNIYGKTKSHLEFLAMRFIEDAGYQSIVRQIVVDQLPSMGMDFFNIDGPRGKVATMVKEGLQKYINEELPKEYPVKIVECYQPWSRMYEVGLKVKIKD